MDLQIVLQSFHETLRVFTGGLVMAFAAIIVLGLIARVAERWGF